MRRFIVFILFLSALQVSAQRYKRIVSLAPSITHNLCLLDAQHLLVGRTQYCLIEKGTEIPVVATAVNVNIEKVANLQPDLVLAGELTHPRTLEALRKLGIKTMSWRQPKNFEEICGQLIEFGELTGQQAKARRTVDESRARLAEVRKGIPDGKPLKLFMEIGARPLYSVLPNTFMHDYIIQLNGLNIAEKLDKGSISKEFVLMQNPDVIIIVSMGGGLDESEIQMWREHSRLSAIQSKRIFVIDQYEVCSPTPIAFVNAVEKMADLIYKK